MSEELRAFAETILRCVVKTETELGTLYERNSVSGMGLSEAWELASAYLAEHPADEKTGETTFMRKGAK